MWDWLLSFSDEALLLAAGSGGTVAWSVFADRRDTPVNIDVAIERVKFGYEQLAVSDWDEILSDARIEEINSDIASMDDIFIDPRFEQEMNEISARSGAVSPCLSRMHSGDEVAKMLRGCYFNYGLFGAYENAASTFARKLKLIESGSDWEFADVCESFQSFIAFSGLMSSLVVATSRGELSLDDLLDEDTIAFAEAFELYYASDKGSAAEASAKVVLDTAVFDHSISQTEDGVDLVVILRGWGFKMPCRGPFQQSQLKSAVQVYSLFAKEKANKLAEFFLRGAHRFNDERRNIENAVNRFNELLSRSVPKLLVVSARVFNSSKYVVTLGELATFQVNDHRFDDIHLKIQSSAKDEGFKLDSRDNARVEFTAEINAEHRDTLWKVYQAGSNTCVINVHPLTRRGDKAIGSSARIFSK